MRNLSDQLAINPMVDDLTKNYQETYDKIVQLVKLRKWYMNNPKMFVFLRDDSKKVIVRCLESEIKDNIKHARVLKNFIKMFTK